MAKGGKYTGLRESPTLMIYVPHRPGPWAGRIVIHLRTAGSAIAIAPALLKAVHDLDRSIPVYNVHTVQDEVDRSLLRERLMGTVTALFGGLALLLAAIGIYGLMSYGVAARTREFGIRVAVGASSVSIVGLVLREAIVLLILGLGVGMAAVLAMTRMVSSLLFGLAPTDALSVASSGIILTAVALVAVWIPARRASKADPTIALRS